MTYTVQYNPGMGFNDGFAWAQVQANSVEEAHDKAKEIGARHSKWRWRLSTRKPRSLSNTWAQQYKIA